MTETKTKPKKHERAELYQALLAVQQDAPVIEKNAINPHFKSKYAYLADIWDAIKDLMKEHQLFRQHLTEAREDGREYFITRIIHIPTGEYIESSKRLSQEQDNPQKFGSFNTYMMRYQTAALLGLVAEEDDDGNAASSPATPANPTKSAPATKKAEKTLTGEVFLGLQKLINEAKTMDDLKEAMDEVNKRVPEMSVAQKQSILASKDKRKQHLEDDIPF